MQTQASISLTVGELTIALCGHTTPITNGLQLTFTKGGAEYHPPLEELKALATTIRKEGPSRCICHSLLLRVVLSEINYRRDLLSL